jgi:uncharacterized protein YggT (Ycf19 family)
MHIASTIVSAFFGFLIIAFLVSMVLSWLPIAPANPFKRTVDRIIQPILGPIDRRIPPVGFIRISFFIAIWAVFFLRELFLNALPGAW